MVEWSWGLAERAAESRSSSARALATLFLALVCLGFSPLLRADSVDVGSFTKTTAAATTTQNVNHGLGEVPKLIIFFTSAETDTTPNTDVFFGFGASDGTNEYSTSFAIEDNVGTTNASRRIASKAITIANVGETVVAEADLTAWTSTNFTLSWTTNNAAAYIIHFIAIGGSGISADVVQWSMPATTGNHAVTGVGFEPDVVIHSLIGGHTVAPSSSSAAGALGLGAMTSTGDEWAIALVTADGAGTSENARVQRTDRCLLAVSSLQVVAVQANYVSMDTDGFTVNVTDTPGGAYQVFSISISGVNADAGHFDKITSGSSQAVTGVLFEPDLLMLASFQRATSTVGEQEAQFGLGATDGTTEGASGMQDEDNVGTSDCDRWDRNDKVFGILDDDSGALSALADLTSFDFDGFTLDWSTNSATATEICYLALIPFAAVKVELAEMTAHAFSPGVEIEWRSERELDNVGYHVYRETGNGARARVTTRLIAGSALWAASGTAIGSAQRYHWFDPTGRVGDRYWIEDHDLDGQTQLHGPIVAHSAPLGRTRPALTTSPLPSVAHTLSTQTPWTPLAPRFADPTTPIDPAVAMWLAVRPGLQIGVDREGWVSVPFTDWVGAGLPRNVRSEQLRLFHRGREHAIEIEDGGDGKFGPGDAVRFYGLGLDTPVTDTAIYTLTLAEPHRASGASAVPGDRPLRIRAITPPGSSGLPETSFLSTVVEAEETQYFAALRNGDEDNFFGELVTDASLARMIAIPHFASRATDPVQLAVSLQGLGASEHNVTIAVNGVVLGNALLTGTEHLTQTIPIPPLLVSPLLEVTLTTSGPSDLVFLDEIAVTYPREFIAGNEFLRGTTPGSSSIILSQASPGTRVFDVTDPSRVVELHGNTVPIPGGPTVAMQVRLPAGPERTWICVPPTAGTSPVSLRANVPSKWRSETQGAEFVIVTPRAWISAIEPLADARRAEGLSTLIVAAEDLYDEWSAGAIDPAAIADFLSLGTRQWREAPRYLLLVGDTTYDPRERLPGTTPSFLPTRLIDSARLETASDQWFGDLDHDGLAEVAVGRLPFSSSEEIEAYVRRAVSRGGLSPSTGPRRALFVADDDDTFPFGAAVHRAVNATSNRMTISRVDRNQLSVPACRGLIETELRQGTDLVAYFGHGGTGGWGAEDLLTTEQVSRLDQQNRHPIVIATSCLNGFFHHRLSETLAESWLSAKGGALAIFASTALSNPYPHRELGLALIGELVHGGPVRIGDAFLAAQLAADAGTRRSTVLLGDPTVSFGP